MRESHPGLATRFVRSRLRGNRPGPWAFKVLQSWLLLGLHAKRHGHPVGLARDYLIPHAPQVAVEHLEQHPRHVLQFSRRDPAELRSSKGTFPFMRYDTFSPLPQDQTPASVPHSALEVSRQSQTQRERGRESHGSFTTMPSQDAKTAELPQ